jgi:hypothetical protein
LLPSVISDYGSILDIVFIFLSFLSFTRYFSHFLYYTSLRRIICLIAKLLQKFRHRFNISKLISILSSSCRTTTSEHFILISEINFFFF